MKTLHWFSIALLVGTVQVCAQDSPTGLSVGPAQRWTNVFAGRKSKLVFQGSATRAAQATLSWSVSVERGVIARGQQVLRLAAGQSENMSVEVEFPDVRPGLIVPGAISLDLRTSTGQQVTDQSVLYVFSPDVVSNRHEFLNSLNLSLFDPGQKTSAALTEAGIPFRLKESPQATAAGLLVFGEGIEPARQAACWQAGLDAAASGRQVILLASSGGSQPLDGLLTAGKASPLSVSLRRADVVRDLDRRLDAVAWPGEKLAVASLHWSSRGNVPQLELRPDAAGWTWLDVKYPGGGRLIWIGLGVTESWDNTPAARYLFVKLLEKIVNEKPEAGGTKHVEE